MSICLLFWMLSYNLCSSLAHAEKVLDLLQGTFTRLGPMVWWDSSAQLGPSWAQKCFISYVFDKYLPLFLFFCFSPPKTIILGWVSHNIWDSPISSIFVFVSVFQAWAASQLPSILITQCLVSVCSDIYCLRHKFSPGILRLVSATLSSSRICRSIRPCSIYLPDLTFQSSFTTRLLKRCQSVI